MFSGTAFFFFCSFFYISAHCSVQQLLMGFNQLHIVSLLMYFEVPKPTLQQHQPPAAESRSTIFTVPHSLQAAVAALPPLRRGRVRSFINIYEGQTLTDHPVDSVLRKGRSLISVKLTVESSCPT